MEKFNEKKLFIEVNDNNFIFVAGKYDENFYYAQDYKLFKDLFKAGYRHKYIKEPLYLLNMKDNISNKFKIEQHYYANCVKRNKLPTKRTQQI